MGKLIQLTERKLGPTQLKAEIERLQAAGRMPSLEQVLAAVGEVRTEYRPKILAARRTARKK